MASSVAIERAGMRRDLQPVAVRGVGDRCHLLSGHVRRGDVAMRVGDTAGDGDLDPLGAVVRAPAHRAPEGVRGVEPLFARVPAVAASHVECLAGREHARADGLAAFD